jgi:hypothetical protein
MLSKNGNNTDYKLLGKIITYIIMGIYGINFQQTTISHVTYIPDDGGGGGVGGDDDDDDDAETVFDKKIISVLTQLITQEYFIAFSHCQSVKFYTWRLITMTLHGYGLMQLTVFSSYRHVTLREICRIYTSSHICMCHRTVCK